MPSTVQRFEGVVLAGGASTRMGTDKADIEVDGVSMLTRAVRALVACGCERVTIVGGPPRTVDGADWRPDTHPGEGPLRAIVASLEGAVEPFVLVVACDHPNLRHDALRLLVEAADPNDAVVIPATGGATNPDFAAEPLRTSLGEVLPQYFGATSLLAHLGAGGGLEPLHALYSASLGGTLRELCERGERSVMRALGSLPVDSVRVIRFPSPLSSSVVDVDTPAELAKVRGAQQNERP